MRERGYEEPSGGGGRGATHGGGGGDGGVQPDHGEGGCRQAVHREPLQGSDETHPGTQGEVPFWVFLYLFLINSKISISFFGLLTKIWLILWSIVTEMLCYVLSQQKNK